MNTLKFIIDFFKGINTSDKKFINAEEAYSKSTYSEQFTREELRDKIIERLKRRISFDIRSEKTYLDISTYDGYREKLVLEEVAEFFKDLGYNVDLLNTENYKEINVLIINWQGLETFK